VRGDLDAHTAGQFRQYLSYLIGQGHHRLVLDLSGSTFIDAAGIEVLAKLAA
jgi:anti-anti-sigma factor